jgi:plastocyanin/FtsP/CotA-like multicopper oxidase with cupredoxin domain
MPDIWIQLESRAWDVAPFNIDRMTGQSVAGSPVPKVITSPETGVTRTRNMWKPLSEDALILRRYTPNWAAPDDRKINPWDLNELDPTDNGTMGTIPGPVIECNLGESVTVHFRNKDARVGKAVEARSHSLHTHGFVFEPKFDGAFPLSPPDPAQPVGAEALLWAAVGVTGFKRGDRVPPGGTFTYTWQTIGWQTTAGVWLYHDHSICDMENVQLGAIGIVVIHNPNDPEDVIVGPNDFPIAGDPNSSPIRLQCFPFPFEVAVMPHQLIELGRVARMEDLLFDLPGPAPMVMPDMPMGGDMSGMAGMAGMAEKLVSAATQRRPAPRNVHRMAVDMPPVASEESEAKRTRRGAHHEVPENERVALDRAFVKNGLVFELSKDLTTIRRLCSRFYRTPPIKAQYLLLFHNLTGAQMCINGRKFLGNTPTVVGGPQTQIRFGVVGMGNVDGFHTFHLHGHRWTINGPHGNTRPTIQSSVQDTPVSQFEDTRTFGPANSFAFTIKEGTIGPVPSFMGPPPGAAVGEWHMHCHVLTHMMDGMMGSLLIVNGGEAATTLPRGAPCPPDMGGGGGGTGTVHVVKLHAPSPNQPPIFDPSTLPIAVGDIVRWQWDDSLPHSTTSDTALWDSGVHTGTPFTFDHTFTGPGSFAYHCAIHGATGGVGMSGTVTVI